MKIYYDTEFTTLDGNVDWDMISAGFVAENGREWYMEITDFLREDCSDFVVETVLPLLGKGDLLPERMAGVHFGWRFANWLSEFGENIELVSDTTCDWWLILGMPARSSRRCPSPSTALSGCLRATPSYQMGCGPWRLVSGLQIRACSTMRSMMPGGSNSSRKQLNLDWSDKNEPTSDLHSSRSEDR